MSLIEIHNVSKDFHTWFSHKPVIKDISLTICQGEFVVLIGENGSGKTTLVNLILGLVSPTTGDIKLMGTSPKSPNSKNYVGVVFQESNLPENMKVRELIQLVRSYYPESISTEELLEAFNLQKKQDDWANKLSGGWKQRLYFSLALASNPKLLILDEPTKEMDDAAYKEFWKQIENCQERGVSILMVTHLKSDRERLTKMANRIITLYSIEDAPLSGQLSEDVLSIALKVTQPDNSNTIKESTSSPFKSLNLVNLFIQQFWVEILQLLRTPIFLITIFLFAGFSALIPSGGENADKASVINFSVFTLLTISFERLGKRVAIERKNCWLKFIRSTPLPPIMYIAVKVSTALLISGFSLILIFVLNTKSHQLSGTFIDWIIPFLTLLLGIIPFALLGLGMSYLIDPKSYDPIAAVIMIIGLSTSGYDLNLSSTIQNLVAFSPFYHYLQLANLTVGLEDDSYLLMHILWLTWASVAFGTVAVWAYRQDRATQ